MQQSRPLGFCWCGCGARTPLAARTHSARGQVKGRPLRYLPGHSSATVSEERLQKQIDRTDQSGCWLWIGPRTTKGYASTSWQGRFRQVHRMLWEREHGPVPAGLYVLHHCDVRHCVNPAHLYVGTQTDNMRDMVVRGRKPSRKGERNGRCKVSEDTVRTIRRRYAAGGVSLRALGDEYGLTMSVVHKIVTRQTWAHVA